MKTTAMEQESKLDSENLPSTKKFRKLEIVWLYVIFFTLLHISALYGVYLLITETKWQTYVFTFMLYVMGMISITAGAHRLWAHKAYKATLPLRLVLVMFFTTAFQFSVIIWVRNHRLHHKYCDTDIDPHNAGRGFFFAHIGWAMVRRNPLGNTQKYLVDLSDVRSDPLIAFQHKHYLKLVIIFCFILPTCIPLLWGQSPWVGFFACALLRHTLIIHGTGLINSAAHLWGNKPYEKDIMPVENKWVSIFAVGEGFHNYHHTFPWDYNAAEFGGYSLNLAKLFIDIMAKIGWAYDLKTVSEELIKKRVKRTGDGSHAVWGWDDKDMSQEDKNSSLIIN